MYNNSYGRMLEIVDFEYIVDRLNKMIIGQTINFDPEMLPFYQGRRLRIQKLTDVRFEISNNKIKRIL